MDLKYIRIGDLIDRGLYTIYARNGRYGYWNNQTKSFIIARFKFFLPRFLDEEYHWDTMVYATVKPLEYLNEQRPDTDKETLIRLTELENLHEE